MAHEGQEGPRGRGAEPDWQKLMKSLPNGTLQGLEEITSHDFWLYVMKQAEIEVSNEELFKYRLQEVSSHLTSRLAFLAGSGEWSSFNAKYLISNIVDQCAEMHRYTRKLEKYCVKLQQKLEQQTSQGRGASDPQGGSDSNKGGKRQRTRSPEPDGEGDGDGDDSLTRGA